MVVARHLVDRVGELCVVPLVDAAAVNPKVLQLVESGLLAAEHDLAVACSSSGMSADQIVRRWLLQPPKYARVWRWGGGSPRLG